MSKKLFNSPTLKKGFTGLEPCKASIEDAEDEEEEVKLLRGENKDGNV